MVTISEFAISHVIRHGNVNFTQNRSTVTNPTKEPIVFFCHLRCRAYNVQNRKFTIISFHSKVCSTLLCTSKQLDCFDWNACISWVIILQIKQTTQIETSEPTPLMIKGQHSIQCGSLYLRGTADWPMVLTSGRMWIWFAYHSLAASDTPVSSQATNQNITFLPWTRICCDQQLKSIKAREVRVTRW